jgi:predicted Zn finger-like uncharacterized protein
MRIICPSCSATYDVPDSLVTPERIVRCARCRNEWIPVQAVPPEPPAAPEPPPAGEPAPRASELPPAEEPAPPRAPPEPPPTEEPAPEVRQSAMDRLSAHPSRPSSGTGLRIAWAVSLVVLLALAGAAFAWHAQVVAAWPPSARAYALFGMRSASQGSRP